MGTIVAIYFAIMAVSLAVIGYLIYDGARNVQKPSPGRNRHHDRRRPHH